MSVWSNGKTRNCNLLDVGSIPSTDSINTQVLGVNGSITVSKTAGGGSNPSGPANHFTPSDGFGLESSKLDG